MPQQTSCTLIESVDIEFYEQHKVDLENVIHHAICCPEILNTTVDVYKACYSSLCHKIVFIIPDADKVHCNYCNSRMSPTSCVDAFKAKVELESKTLSIRVEVLVKILEIDIIKTYYQNMDALVVKTLYLESVNNQYNSETK